MKKLLRKILVVVISVLFAIGIVGCGNDNSSTNQSTTGQSVNSGEVSYPVDITDSFDKKITLDSEPKKIISVAPNMTELIYDLGAGDELIGRTDYCDYPEEVKDVESIGTMRTPDMEKIISLQPDLVITSTHFNEENAVKLEEAGIKVMGLYEKNDVTGVYSMIEKLGTALNKQDKANELVGKMKSDIQDVGNKVKDLDKPSVYYVVSYGDGGDYSAPQNTFVGQLLTLAGGNDIVPASDNWSYSKESLIEENPDIIIIKKGEKEKFESTEGYKDLTAVKEGRVYEIDHDLLDRQGYRNAEGVLELAKIFHPDAFK